MTNKTKMLPCPFCGDMPVKLKSYGDERDGYADCVSYVCKTCGCARGARGDSSKGGYADNSGVEQKALDAWNTRAAPPEDVRAVVDGPVLWFKPLPGLLAKPNGQTYDVMFADVPGYEPLYRRPQRPIVMPDKYDDVLLPFLAMMRAELHANVGKGDRPGWLAMSSDTCLLEIFYHLGKLQKAVKNSDAAGMTEYAADVANMCMMLLDICGALAFVEPPAPVALVLPERMEIPDVHCPERINAQGWNACLDEVRRLNP